MTIVATLFTEAWQISAFTDGTRAGREEFFSRVWNAYQSVMFWRAPALFPAVPAHYEKCMYPMRFMPGWVYIPLLTFATVFPASTTS